MGSAAPMLIGIVAVPYIYKHIGIERIGVLTIIWALIGYFSIFDFGLGRAITQRIASLATCQTLRQKKTTATTGVFLTFLIGILGGLFGFAVLELVGVHWVNSASNLLPEIRASFLLACIAIPATTTSAGLRGILEGEQRFKTINQLKVILGFSNFLGPIISIALFGPRLEYIVGSLIISRYAVLAALYYTARHSMGNATESLTRQESMLLFKFGGWMTLSNIVSPLMSMADRIYISSVLGAGLVAYYTIPADLLFRLLIIPAALTTTLFPIFSQNKNDQLATTKYYRMGVKVVLGPMLAITVIISIFGRMLLSHWLGPEFATKSYDIAVIISIGVLFTSIAQIPFAYIQATGDARSTALIHLIELTIYVPTLMYLTHLHGIVGAAVAWSLRAASDLALLQLRAGQIKSTIKSS